MGGFQTSLVVSLKGAKDKGLVGNEEFVGREEQLIICGKSQNQFIFMLLISYSGLALCLYNAALESDPDSPSMVLHWSDSRQMRLDASTCPDGCFPFLSRWLSVVPRIKRLPSQYTFDLECIICGRLPASLPSHIPDPFPFSPTAEEEVLATIHAISAELRTIAFGICYHRSFQLQNIENLSAALAPSIGDIVEVIGSHMVRCYHIITLSLFHFLRRQPVSEIITILEHHGCQNLTNILDLPSCSDNPVTRGAQGATYLGRLNDGTKVAVKVIHIMGQETHLTVSPRKSLRICYPNNLHAQHAAREMHTWSRCRHRNVLHLLGLAEFRGRIAMLSLWMDNGNLPAYINTHPNIDRLDLVCRFHLRPILSYNVCHAWTVLSSCGWTCILALYRSCKLSSSYNISLLKNHGLGSWRSQRSTFSTLLARTQI
jgi:hypothetical protein